MSVELTLIDLLREIETTVRRYRERIEEGSKIPLWVRERINLLGAINDSPGQRVSQEEFYRIGERNGYSHQGLGGLFRNPAKVRYDSDANLYVELTDFGRQELAQFRQQYTQ